MQKTLTEKRFFEWHEDDKSVNIRASSGSYGGGSEVLVVGTITTNTYQVITNGDEPIAPILSSDAHRGGAWLL